jgi:hypothetical protein
MEFSYLSLMPRQARLWVKRKDGGPVKGRWTTQNADPSGEVRLRSAWARPDGTPPEGFEIVEPLFVSISRSTTKNDIIEALRICQRVLHPEGAKHDRRFWRGLRYWLKWRGVAEMPSEYLRSVGFEAINGIPMPYLWWVLLEYLRTNTKPPRKRLEQVAAEIGDEGVSTEIVRRDINHFRARARSMYATYLPGDKDLPNTIRRVEKLPAKFADALSRDPSLGTLLELVELNSPSLRRKRRKNQ